MTIFQRKSQSLLLSITAFFCMDDWLPGAREDFSAELEYVFNSINIY